MRVQYFRFEYVVGYFLGYQRYLNLHNVVHEENNNESSGSEQDDDQFNSNSFVMRDEPSKHRGTFKSQKFMEEADDILKNPTKHMYKFQEGRDCPICLYEMKDFD